MTDAERMIEDGARILEDALPWRPELFGVLGSGLSPLAESLEEAVSVPFSELPSFPASSVAGHQGRYVAGLLEGRRVLLQAGRFHLYEGHAPDVVVAPVRIASRLGVTDLLLTNAAGGVDPALEPGTILLIEDHLNLQGQSPLTGPVQPGEERFPDMSEVYDKELRARALSAASDLGVPLARGVYAAMGGPAYETPAEIRMLRALGADAVGMSTVPEATVARARGMRVLAFSLITNKAAGLEDAPLSHAEVLETGREAAATLEHLIRRVVREVGFA